MNLPANYGALEPHQRRLVREEYVRLQNGACWFCGHPLSGKSPYELNRTEIAWHRFPPKFLRWPVHLHHDHGTGMTAGAVHAYCNAVSFHYIESPDRGLPPLEPKPRCRP